MSIFDKKIFTDFARIDPGTGVHKYEGWRDLSAAKRKEMLALIPHFTFHGQYRIITLALRRHIWRLQDTDPDFPRRQRPKTAGTDPREIDWAYTLFNLGETDPDLRKIEQKCRVLYQDELTNQLLQKKRFSANPVVENLRGFYDADPNFSDYQDELDDFDFDEFIVQPKNEDYDMIQASVGVGIEGTGRHVLNILLAKPPTEFRPETSLLSDCAGEDSFGVSPRNSIGVFVNTFWKLVHFARDEVILVLVPEDQATRRTVYKLSPGREGKLRLTVAIDNEQHRLFSGDAKKPVAGMPTKAKLDGSTMTILLPAYEDRVYRANNRKSSKTTAGLDATILTNAVASSTAGTIDMLKAEHERTKQKLAQIEAKMATVQEISETEDQLSRLQKKREMLIATLKA